jgi:hypothetical protein
MKKLFQNFAFRAFWGRRGEGGGVTAYSAFFVVFAIGLGALAIDVGRMTVLRSQMQDRADAGAMAAAVHLDGREGAQVRATAVAMNAMSQISGIPGDGQDLNVQTVNFYSEYDPTPVAATGDEDSKFVEVILEPRRVNFFLEPILNPSGDQHYKNLAARAVAGANPFICQAPPLMVCDLGETDPTMDLALESNIGRQIVLKPPPSGGSAWGPGNYGLLALPDGSIGADDIETALAAVEPADCYSIDVSTAPGVKTKKVKHGINARFELDHLPYPAPNVINYPKDVEIEADSNVVMGSGNWGIDAYWEAKHGGDVPDELDDDASRYQVYLYELGLQFGRNDRQTIYPVNGALLEGYTPVSPGGPGIPEDAANPDDPDYDGMPSQTVAANGYARRLVQVAVLQCAADGVKGSHTYPTNGNFLEMFLTQSVNDIPAGNIYGEIVRPLSPSNDPDFHANVKLID